MDIFSGWIMRRRAKKAAAAKWICAACKQEGQGNADDHAAVWRRSTIAKARAERAPHNPFQQVILASEASQRSATQLVTEAGSNVPALVSAVGAIAQRFEQFVANIHDLNKGLGEFKNEVMVPFREELKYLRYNTGDRLNHVSGDLEKYVAKLDQVLWGALRANGMSDEAIRAFRTEHGMEPEAPRGYELEAHMREVEELRAQNAALIRQNQRLLARVNGHWFSGGEGEWVYKEDCPCGVCLDHRNQLKAAQVEAAGASEVTP